MKNNKITALLGMKQENMAMLLQISLGQWAMFETGKRDLPSNAMQKLSEMLTFLNQPEQESKNNFEHIKIQEAKTAKVFQDLQLINKHQQLIAERKLASIQKKYHTAMTALKFVRFLETNSQDASQQFELLTIIKLNAENALQKNDLHVQAKQELKLNTLKQQQLLIDEAIQKLE